MKATIINPDSKHCGAHGTVSPAAEYDGIAKPYLFELDDENAEYVNRDDFIDGYLQVQSREGEHELGEYIRGMAHRSPNWRGHIVKMLGGYSRIVYDAKLGHDVMYMMSRKGGG